MPNYYVWAKIIEALADLGYDPNMLVRAPAACAIASPELSTACRPDGRLSRAVCTRSVYLSFTPHGKMRRTLCSKYTRIVHCKRNRGIRPDAG